MRNLPTGEDGVDERFKRQVISKCGEHVTVITVDDNDTFAFVECKDGAGAAAVEAYCNGLSMGNGVILTGVLGRHRVFFYPNRTSHTRCIYPHWPVDAHSYFFLPFI